MDINPSDYPCALKLHPGDCIKVPHLGCSNSPAMKIRCCVDGIKFYCHKCGSYHYENSFNSPRERLRRLEIYNRAMELQANTSYDVPADASQTIPADGLTWLGKGGWTVRMIREHNITWSESLNRVIIPVQPFGYTARSVHSWLKPKYLEKSPQGAFWTRSPDESSQACVITEDILSAGRCGCILPAYALLGTSVDTATLSLFIKYKTVFVWLDPDKAGVTGSKKLIHRLRIICDDVRLVHSDTDPKLLPDNEIQERLIQ